MGRGVRWATCAGEIYLVGQMGLEVKVNQVKSGGLGGSGGSGVQVGKVAKKGQEGRVG